MRVFAILTFLGVLAFSSTSFGEVVMIKSKHRDVTQTDGILVAQYNQKIDQLDHQSSVIGSKILSRKNGLNTDAPARDGMQVVLVRARR